jgi:hypothetical protein
MTKIWLAVLTITLIICSFDGQGFLADGHYGEEYTRVDEIETFLGPYYLTFNNTDHQNGFATSPKSIIIVTNESIFLKYNGVSSYNNSTIEIVIFEGKMRREDIENVSSIDTEKGFVELERFPRIIDGYDAMVGKYKNESDTWIAQLAVFNFSVLRVCNPRYGNGDYDDNAVVRIYATNYTNYEFDRFLDTFRISRLVERN